MADAMEDEDIAEAAAEALAREHFADFDEEPGEDELEDDET